ncbi:alkylmercury lyase family protein [Kribbella swartbergensis]
MKLEVLHVPDCPNLGPMLDRLGQVTDLPVSTRVIDSDADAARFGMAGSPTLLIDGRDPFSAMEGGWSVSCRLYRDEAGRIVSAPSVEQLRAAIAGRGEPATPAGVLSAWRARALPLDPVEKAVHQAILRAFATTGRPPSAGELDTVIVAGGAGPSVAATLDALHAADAIRLAPDGQIAVAYPFSAVPTRHRVHIGDQATGVDVYAMCAIDALGIGPMLGEDTLIESVDTTTNQAITVTTTGGHSRWEPDTAVVFVGADGRGGPSADCCCDYLNFFTDLRTANAWTTTHPDIPGHVLDQAAAEALATRLFGHLLVDQQV